MAKISEETIAAVKAANPSTEVHLLTHDELPDQVIVRSPTGAEWRMFRNMQSDDDGGQKVAAGRMLVDSCVVHPPKGELAAMLEAHPGLVETWAGEIVEIAGVTRKATRKKL